MPQFLNHFRVFATFSFHEMMREMRAEMNLISKAYRRLLMCGGPQKAAFLRIILKIKTSPGARAAYDSAAPKQQNP